MRRLFTIKIGSITRRWILNVLTVVIAAVFIAELIVLILIRNVYYNGVRAVAEDYLRPFEVLAAASEEEFYDKARTAVKDFQYRDRIEVQVIDKYGYMVVSTHGFNRWLSHLGGALEYRRENTGRHQFVNRFRHRV